MSNVTDDGPVIVTAVVDLERRSSKVRQPRVRGVTELMELAPDLIRVRLPMVIFAEADLLEDLVTLRRELAPDIPSEVVAFEPHQSWDTDVSRLDCWLARRRPLCSSNDLKDTPEYLALGWSKAFCIRRASQLIRGSWYWWIDIGISHTSPVPSDADRILETLSTRTEPKGASIRPGWSPAIQLVSLECEGWHADHRNIASTRKFARDGSEQWWFDGAQLVAGGIIGVASRAVGELEDAFRGAKADAEAREAAVTDEMLLTRWHVLHPYEARLHPGGYSDMFGALRSPSRPRIETLCPTARFVRLPDPKTKDRAALNPSIAADPEGGFRVVVRHANYQYSGGEYQPLDNSDLIVTDNVLVRLSSDFEVLWSQPIEDRRARVSPPLFPVHGLEDLRLFRHGGRWKASATSREHRRDGLCQIVVVEFDDSEPARIASAFRLPALRSGRHEKNWMPFVAEGRTPLAFLWSAVPPRVVSVDDVLQAVTVDGAPSPEWNPGHVRGGSQVIPVDGGWLATVHRAVPGRGHTPRIYEHRIIHFDVALDILHWSPWFVFAIEGIEFCAGMAADDSGVVLSFGVEDREAWLVHVDWEDLSFVLDADLGIRGARP